MFVREIAPEAAWTQEMELLAESVEMTDRVRLMIYAANVKPGTQIPEPLHIRRPWDPTPQAPTFLGLIGELDKAGGGKVIVLPKRKG